MLRTALGEAAGQSMGETVEPGPLGPEAISTLLSQDGMPRVDVTRLLAETRGLAEAHLAVVTELVEDTGSGRLARAEADRAVVAYRRGDADQAAKLGRAALACAQAAADPGATTWATPLARRSGRWSSGRDRLEW